MTGPVNVEMVGVGGGPQFPINTAHTWKALLTQTSTNAPTANVLINGLQITGWTYNMAGNYTINAPPGTFKPGKTEVWGGNGEYGQGICISTGYIHDDAINIIVSQQSFGPGDGYLVNTPFTITVYK